MPEHTSKGRGGAPWPLITRTARKYRTTPRPAVVYIAVAALIAAGLALGGWVVFS